MEATKRALPAVHGFQSDVSDPIAITALHRRVVAEFPLAGCSDQQRQHYAELELRTWNRELPRAAHFFGNKTSFSVAITAG
jgi:hypothetical protein